MGAPFQPFLDLGEGGCHGELDIRLLLGVRTHQSATGHMGVGGGHAIEEVALIGSSIVILLGIHGMVGAGAAALRSPQDLEILRQAVELGPVAFPKGVLSQHIVAAEIPVSSNAGVLLDVPILDGTEPQLVGLAHASAHKGV